MKTVSKFILTLVAVCLVNVATQAKDTSYISIKNVENDVIAIELNNASQTEVEVSLKDARGITIYEETVVTDNINRRKYDLQNLPVGSYTLHIAYDNVIKIQKVVKHFDNANLEMGALQTVFKPTFNVHSSYVDLDMMCLDNQNISIEIRDIEGNTIFSEEAEPKGAIQKRFNLSQLEEGSYNFYVEIDGVVFTEEFSRLVNWTPSIAGL